MCAISLLLWIYHTEKWCFVVFDVGYSVSSGAFGAIEIMSLRRLLGNDLDVMRRRASSLRRAGRCRSIAHAS